MDRDERYLWLFSVMNNCCCAEGCDTTRMDANVKGRERASFDSKNDLKKGHRELVLPVVRYFSLNVPVEH